MATLFLLEQRNASLISSHEVRLYGHSLFGIKLQYLQDITVLDNLKVSASFLHIDPYIHIGKKWFYLTGHS